MQKSSCLNWKFRHYSADYRVTSLFTVELIAKGMIPESMNGMHSPCRKKEIIKRLNTNSKQEMLVVLYALIKNAKIVMFKIDIWTFLY